MPSPQPLPCLPCPDRESAGSWKVLTLFCGTLASVASKVLVFATTSSGEMRGRLGTWSAEKPRGPLPPAPSASGSFSSLSPSPLRVPAPGPAWGGWRSGSSPTSSSSSCRRLPLVAGWGVPPLRKYVLFHMIILLTPRTLYTLSQIAA